MDTLDFLNGFLVGGTLGLALALLWPIFRAWLYEDDSDD